MLFELLLVLLLGVLHKGNTEQTCVSEEVQPVSRRYAESTIGSEISKLMDSMVQKSFVDFLLDQREKKDRPAATAEDERDLQPKRKI